jgi:hypothetical protein
MAEGVEITRELNRNFILADGFQLLVRQGNSIPLMLRSQAQAERPPCPVEEFERVRKLRPQLTERTQFSRMTNPPKREKTQPPPPSDAAPNEPFLRHLFALGVGAALPPANLVAPTILSPVPLTLCQAALDCSGLFAGKRAGGGVGIRAHGICRRL